MTGGWQAAKLATMRVGGQSEVGRLLSVAVKPADDAFRSAATIDVQWRDLGYTAAPALGGASTNDAGTTQHGGVEAECVDAVVVVALRHWGAPEGVIHLMSAVRPIARACFLRKAELLPVPFREDLLARGIQLAEVPPPE